MKIGGTSPPSESQTPRSQTMSFNNSESNHQRITSVAGMLLGRGTTPSHKIRSFNSENWTAEDCHVEGTKGVDQTDVSVCNNGQVDLHTSDSKRTPQRPTDSPMKTSVPVRKSSPQRFASCEFSPSESRSERLEYTEKGNSSAMATHKQPGTPLKRSVSMRKLSPERGTRPRNFSPERSTLSRPDYVVDSPKGSCKAVQRKVMDFAIKSPVDGGRSPSSITPTNAGYLNKGNEASPKVPNMSPLRSVQAPFDSPKSGIFDSNKPELFVCHRADRIKVLASRSNTDYRGIFRSVAQALCKASDGDIINVSGGIYDESITISCSVLIRALPGEEVVLRATDTSLVSSNALNAKIEKITLQHSGGDVILRGRDGPRCICVLSGELIVEDCKITSSTGSGFMVCDAGSAVIRKCDISHSARCGLICIGGGICLCEDSAFSHNRLNGVDLQSGSKVTIRRCTMNENGQTGVLVSDEGSTATLQKICLSGNLRRGITAQNFGVVNVENCLVSGSDLGIFIMGDESSHNSSVITKSTVTGNKSAAIFIHGSGPVMKDNVTEGKIVTGTACNSPPPSPLGQRFPSGDLARSPLMIARRLASAMVIQCSWRMHKSRKLTMTVLQERQTTVRAHYQDTRVQIDNFRRNCDSKSLRSPVETIPPEFRVQGMAAFEADLIDTLNRFDQLESRMGAILAEAGM